jgi:hypothetical protein
LVLHEVPEATEGVLAEGNSGTRGKEGALARAGSSTALGLQSAEEGSDQVTVDDLPVDLRDALSSIYEKMMWLSKRPNVTAGRARSWYTHVMAESVKRRLRQFSGSVSIEAAHSRGEPLRLEHYLRIQTILTSLVERHREQPSLSEFIETLVACERVHIVTVAENYAAMRAKGDYALAGIELTPWLQLPESRRAELWRTMLRGRVANAATYAPMGTA